MRVSHSIRTVLVRQTDPMAKEKTLRGTVTVSVQQRFTVDAETKRQFDNFARQAGVSNSYFFTKLVESIKVNDRGLPTWWPEDLSRDGELPIDSD